ncbi:SPRY domain-containing protein 7 [Cimex lectularius]|uniref:SPRY domain-containing protein 7 n=1 Tax=Cimex lectularius TaxID=79782 RepID=A0A8I6RHZ0_CIMLE|nr:SPRY domain-containing protein 7 [Cimex lectularius]
MALASICCFKACFEGTGFTLKTAPVRNNNERICLDGRHVGHEVVLIKNLVRVCGSGGTLCTAPLVQNKSYFEVKVQQGGVWGVGVATRSADLNKPPGGLDSESWVFCSDGNIRHNGTIVHQIADKPMEGDIIGVTYDHIDLNFFVNGKPLEKPVSGIRGTVYPTLFVDQGAVLDFIPEDFLETQPNGFEPIMIEKSLL